MPAGVENPVADAVAAAVVEEDYDNIWRRSKEIDIEELDSTVK